MQLSQNPRRVVSLLMPLMLSCIVGGSLEDDTADSGTPAADAGDSADGGGGADAGQCAGGTALCNGDCVDLDSSEAHCGACNEACPAVAECIVGQCVVEISGPLSGLIAYPNASIAVAGDVEVIAWNGTDDVTQCDAGETGCLRLEANSILVRAGVTIDATGKGYGGGGGGGGGPGNAGNSLACEGSCTSCSVGARGQGTRGGHDGSTGGTGVGQSISGAGGRGGGTFGGTGGAAVTSNSTDGPNAGRNGSAGGYAAAASNGDTSTDEAVRMGSGGGGASGGASAYEPFYSSVGGSGGGGAGNAGGGYVALVASERLAVWGDIRSKGDSQRAGNGGAGTNGSFNGLLCDLEGSGGSGGSAGATGNGQGAQGVSGFFQAGYNACIDRQCENNGSGAVVGGNGGNGGNGAGGGVLLKAPEIELTGAIDARGGASATNGGTVKLFHGGTAPPEITIQAGRILSQAY